jgi:hypothetical protein
VPSNYAAFDVLIDNDDGTTTPVAGETIGVYDVTNDAPLADTASDADGHVPGDTVAVDAGTELRFSFSRANGICGFSEVLTV